jgi:eukaryotic-like serine/threonine-protein kinase
VDPISERLRIALTGRYAVERELGRGGMALVFLARDLRHERLVALKVLRPELSPSLGGERFLREIRLAAVLQHPHILPLFDSGEAAGLLYYVMPYVEGESLRARLEREPQLPMEETLKIARETADALQYAHERDVVHRDIKPENILLSGGHALVADFGIARAIRAAGGLKLTDTGLAVGTPAYMSPEQATGQAQVDGRADIYALGCLVYEMLTGAPPFTGPSAQAVMARHSVDPVPPLATVRAVPAALERAVFKALAKSPADRWASATAFADALSSAVPATRVSEASPHDRSPVLKRLAVAIAAALAVVALGWAAWPGRSGPSAEAGAPGSLSSVAVLPFVLIGDTTNAHIASGLTEAVVTGLVKLEGVRVPATSGILAKQSNQDPREIGRSLQVGMVLSSSLQMARGKLRLTSRLIDVQDGLTVWSEHFDGELVDVFAMQDSITYRIVRALKPRLAPAARAALDRSPGTRDPEAYNLYMLARYFYAQATPAALRRAVDYYRQAIARDSTYADPLVGLVQTYLLFENVEPGTKLKQNPTPQELLSRALAIDSTHGGAHNLLGRYRWLACDTAGAEREFQAAIRFEPGSAENRRQYTLVLFELGRSAEAVALMREAAALEPTSPWVLAVLAVAYMGSGQHDSAYAVAERGFGIDSTNWVANAVFSGAKLQAGDTMEGIRLLEASRRLGGERHSLTIGHLGVVYARAGRRGDAERIADELARRVPRGQASRFDLARVYVALGDHERALHWLEQRPATPEEYSSPVPELESDPRYEVLARRVCLKP